MWFPLRFSVDCPRKKASFRNSLVQANILAADVLPVNNGEVPEGM
jgi:hypothetical protein